MAAPAQLPERDGLYRIGDVSRLTDTKPFVLRFWETEFSMLQPVKTAKGHRLYRQDDVDMVLLIKRLLYQEGFTIPGARRHLSELLANGETASSLLQQPLGAQPARHTSDPADSLFPETPAVKPSVAQGVTEVTRQASEAPARAAVDSRAALLAVRDELRLILTMLETR